MNTLIVIGYLSGKTCYLNISREEAIERYKKENDVEGELDVSVEEVHFKDSFGAYEVWEN